MRRLFTASKLQPVWPKSAPNLIFHPENKNQAAAPHSTLPWPLEGESQGINLYLTSTFPVGCVVRGVQVCNDRKAAGKKEPVAVQHPTNHNA